MFDRAVAEARRTHWFEAGGVPDTVEGRFSVLATVVAMLLVRLEQLGDEGESASVALSERFIEAIDAEIREMGVGDPALGKQVRALVGALARRVERWRSAVEGGDWTAAARRSLYRDMEVADAALAEGEKAARDLWERLQSVGVEELNEGRIG